MFWFQKAGSTCFFQIFSQLFIVFFLEYHYQTSHFLDDNHRACCIVKLAHIARRREESDQPSAENDVVSIGRHLK
jgi:hypothetical protein